MREIAYYDPLLFKCPKGPVTKFSEVTFNLKVKPNSGVRAAWFMVKSDNGNYEYKSMQYQGRSTKTKLKSGKETFEDIDHYEITETFGERGHYWYNFKLETDYGDRFVSKTYSNFSQVLDYKGEDFFQLVTEKEYEVAKTDEDHILEGGVIYQIMVDRFAKVGKPVTRVPLVYREDWGGKLCKNTTDPVEINHEVFGGNFKGVLSKLDYIASLGVTAIYFNPICKANSNHKYDTANYMQVDDMYGTEEDFKKLIDEAKKRNIKIVIDGVYNHTGSDSIYFNKEKHFGEGGAYNDPNSEFYDWYEWVKYPNEYASWWGIDTLPNTRDNSESFRNYIAGEGGVIDKYMKLGVAGIRFDVADEISDEFLKIICDRIRFNNKNAVIMGEVWEDAATKISYSKRRKYFSDYELNSVMNYPVKESILNYLRCKEPYDLVSTIRMLQNNYPLGVQHNLMNFLGTHDTGRIMSELLGIAEGNVDIAKKLLKIAVGLTFTMTGVPSIFYGDEYGMENNDGSSRGCFDWNNTNKDIFEMYKKFAEVRKNKVFKTGDLNILYSKNGKFVFERIGVGERVIVLCNLRDSSLDVELEGNYVSLLSGDKYKNKTLSLNYLDLMVLAEQK